MTPHAGVCEECDRPGFVTLVTDEDGFGDELCQPCTAMQNAASARLRSNHDRIAA